MSPRIAGALALYTQYSRIYQASETSQDFVFRLFTFFFFTSTAAAKIFRVLIIEKPRNGNLFVLSYSRNCWELSYQWNKKAGFQ